MARVHITLEINPTMQNAAWVKINNSPSGQSTRIPPEVLADFVKWWHDYVSEIQAGHLGDLLAQTAADAQAHHDNAVAALVETKRAADHWRGATGAD